MYGLPLFAINLSGEFFAALIGALIGGAFTILGSYLANTHQAKLQRKQELESIQDYMQSIHDELDAAWNLYFENVGRKLEESRAGEPFAYKWQASSNYFRIYESNLGLLPKISDGDLRRKIIKTYFYANSLVDSLHLNSSMIVELETLSSLANQLGDDGARHYMALNQKTNQLISYRDTLLSIHSTAKSSLTDLLDSFSTIKIR